MCKGTEMRVRLTLELIAVQSRVTGIQTMRGNLQQMTQRGKHSPVMEESMALEAMSNLNFILKELVGKMQRKLTTDFPSSNSQ